LSSCRIFYDARYPDGDPAFLVLPVLIERILCSELHAIVQQPGMFNVLASETSQFFWHPVTYQFFFAFLNSCLHSKQKAAELAIKAYTEMSELEVSTWTLGVGLLFLGKTYKNISSFDKSSEFYDRAILFAEESQYFLIKANALLGKSEIYREQQEYHLAILSNLNAIELLEKFNAKCYFSEAYYQLGLTYQATSEIEKSDANFQKAIRLFTEMEAPKQVERVRRSMHNHDIL
jgi:tetratricopeptide (TPR) repeat protein